MFTIFSIDFFQNIVILLFAENVKSFSKIKIYNKGYNNARISFESCKCARINETNCVEIFFLPLQVVKQNNNYQL